MKMAWKKPGHFFFNYDGCRLVHAHLFKPKQLLLFLKIII